MGRTRLAAVAACAAAVVGVGASAALAGEITGNGKPLWTSTDPVTGEHTLQGKSLCAFSGQEDDRFLAPGEWNGKRAQSWGQIPKEVRDFLTSVGSNPGIACNPTKSGGE